MATIHSPLSTYTGRTFIGPLILDFTDGKATHDGDLGEGLTQYLAAQGYGVDKAAAEAEEPPEPPDPREVGLTQVGTPLRDAAVDPRPEDFLAPTNAGEANPHGSSVVSPEIHGSQGVRPILGGPVDVEDPDAQEAAELHHAEDATSGEPVDNATTDPDAEHDAFLAREQETAQAATTQPAGNASKADWREYAITRGLAADEADSLTRDELRARFTEQG